ncbi:MAG: FHA domain-containing protein [Victivallales bacterium]|nr:FHA domain-containing protein [Victivallales bacterium]
MSTAKITILSDPLRGTSFPLKESLYTVGRNDSADICIPEPTISGHHCSLTLLEDGTYSLKDEGSTNGTRLNNQKLEPQQPMVLKDSDLIPVGNVEILFESKEGKAQSTVKTMTVINLDDTGTMDITNTGLQNIGMKVNKRDRVVRENRKHNMIFIVILAILLLLVLVCLGFLVSMILHTGK